MRKGLALLSMLLLAASAQSQALLPARTEPRIERRVIEDDGARIEELKVRGEVRRIVVHPKAEGARPYEIVPDSGRRDPSQEKGASGQRVWNVLNF